VVDASTGEYLPGANIALSGTNLGAASDREGFFIILNVPQGTYQLNVNYIGYADFSLKQPFLHCITGHPVAELDHLGGAIKLIGLAGTAGYFDNDVR